MSIIEKVFHYEESEITVIKCRDEIWFRGKDIAKALGYEKTRNAILKHVNDDDKSILEDLRRGPQIRAPFKNEQGGSIFINNKKRSHTQLDSRKQVIAFQDRAITINIKEAQHPLK